MAKQSSSVKKIEPDTDVVLINRDSNRKHIPYSKEPGTGTMLGVAGKDGPGISKLHCIHPGVNPPIPRMLFDQINRNDRFKVWMKSRVVYELAIDISDMEHESCESMLKRSSSIDGLKWWLSNETRKDWRKTLKGHIKEMEDIARRKGDLQDEDSED